MTRARPDHGILRPPELIYEPGGVRAELQRTNKGFEWLAGLALMGTAVALAVGPVILMYLHMDGLDLLPMAPALMAVLSSTVLGFGLALGLALRLRPGPVVVRLDPQTLLIGEMSWPVQDVESLSWDHTGVVVKTSTSTQRIPVRASPLFRRWLRMNLLRLQREDPGSEDDVPVGLAAVAGRAAISE